MTFKEANEKLDLLPKGTIYPPSETIIEAIRVFGLNFHDSLCHFCEHHKECEARKITTDRISKCNFYTEHKREISGN